ncbi:MULTISPECIES: hypothetical protein [Staphylococcus]|uniref:hypothetical protein n=1 Tax=Staphylococcus TaxID=1279 RepID=UPI0021CE977B|nr:hypothetical protein [Staphylococcus sp. IVB6181]UXV35211.1 hypothetical protein MUA90_01315 [Staphylococcus sp. IVB6181]
MKSILLKSSCAIGAMFMLLPSGQSHAQVDQYEVKVYAKADKIVKDNRHIQHDILEQLGSEDKDEDFSVQYIDDAKRTNYGQNITYRVRKSEEDTETKLQYKKRYPIMNGDVESAVSKAKQDGFQTDEYEVEYGEGKQTLSASNEAKVSLGSQLPDVSKSLEVLQANAKSPFKSLLQFSNPSLIGPVHFERHKGNIGGNEVKIENWDIGSNNVVEISSKVSSESEAKSVQQSIIHKLDTMGIHETNDQLKTDMIFLNY